MPKTCIVIQTHNKRNNLTALIDLARRSGADELIVIDDGSSDGSSAVLSAELVGRNEFVLHANDLFEIRTYNKALRMTTAPIVALLQDDDLLGPAGHGWLSQANAWFSADEKLAVVGGRDGMKLVSDGKSVSYEVGDQVGAKYVDYVNRAPFIVRREAWVALDGFDETFAPFQCDDLDFCVRAWMAGWRIGHLGMPFVRDVGVGGMRLVGDEFRDEQTRRNWGIVAQRYASMLAGDEWPTTVKSSMQDSPAIPELA